METAREQKATSKHFWVLGPFSNGISRVFRGFELDWSIGLTLDHRDTLADTITGIEFGNL